METETLQEQLKRELADLQSRLNLKETELAEKIKELKKLRDEKDRIADLKDEQMLLRVRTFQKNERLEKEIEKLNQELAQLRDNNVSLVQEVQENKRLIVLLKRKKRGFFINQVTDFISEKTGFNQLATDVIFYFTLVIVMLFFVWAFSKLTIYLLTWEVRRNKVLEKENKKLKAQLNQKTMK